MEEDYLFAACATLIFGLIAVILWGTHHMILMSGGYKSAGLWLLSSLKYVAMVVGIYLTFVLIFKYYRYRKNKKEAMIKFANRI